MKPKSNRKPGALDLCQTPTYAVTPLLPYLNKDWLIWEPAAGEGYLAAALRRAGHHVYETDIHGTRQMTQGRDFFSAQPFVFDGIVTNPPYSIKAKWIARCCYLDKPFALLVPVETMARQDVQRLDARYGFEYMLLSARVNFKMPNKGWAGKGAQFPVMWLCHRLLPNFIVHGHIDRDEPLIEPTGRNDRR